jgi:hypothetical protein
METTPYLYSFPGLDSYIHNRYRSTLDVFKGIHSQKIQQQQLRHVENIHTQQLPNEYSADNDQVYRRTSNSSQQPHQKSSLSPQLYLATVEIRKSKRKRDEPGSSTNNRSTTTVSANEQHTSTSASSSSSLAPSQLGHQQPTESRLLNIPINTNSKNVNTPPSNIITAGYLLACYDPDTSDLVVLDLILRVPTMQQGTIESDLIKAVWDDISRKHHAASNALDEGEGAHAVLWMVMEEDFIKWRGQMARMGFLDVKYHHQQQHQQESDSLQGSSTSASSLGSTSWSSSSLTSSLSLLASCTVAAESLEMPERHSSSTFTDLKSDRISKNSGLYDPDSTIRLDIPSSVSSIRATRQTGVCLSVDLQEFMKSTRPLSSAAPKSAEGQKRKRKRE